MAVENLFPNYKGCNGIDGNRQHAEATEAVQAAWDRTVAANARNELEADARRKAIKKLEEVRPVGCVFAKSCTLPDGIINHNPCGFIPLELLSQYGAYAVLGASSAASASGTALQWIGGSGSAMELAKRLGGTLSTLAPQCEDYCWHGVTQHDFTRQRVLHVRAIRRTHRSQYAGAGKR